MAMFTGYFDESDTDAASVIAGVLLSVEQLPCFDSEWSSLLAEHGLTCLHMKDFAHFKGEFKHGWRENPQRRREFLRRAIGIIARRCNIGISITIDRKGYLNASAKFPAFGALYGNEYTAASVFAIMRTCLWAQKYGYPPANYVFDMGNPNRTAFEQGFYNLYNDGIFREGYKVSSLSFADDVHVPALQAADLVAYETSKVYTDVKHDKPRFRASLQELMENVIGDWRIAEEKDLIRMATAFGVKGLE